MPIDTLEIDFDDLQLDELSVTSIHDSAALPETGTSSGSCSNTSCCTIDEA